MKTLIDWLTGLPGISSVRPVRVTIKKETFSGAYYKQYVKPPEGSAIHYGYDREAFYLLGLMPKFLLKHQDVFTLDNDKRDWFPSVYIYEIKPQFAFAHPFGSNFIISPWDCASETIDQHEDKKRNRLPLIVA